MKRIVKIVAAVFTMLALTPVAQRVHAQNTVTPYSMYGYGILGDKATSMQRQMGSIGYAMNSGRQINVMNPASYAAIDSLTFLFDMGADVSMLHSKEGSAKEKSTGGGLDYITMQFPITKYMGGSIGLLPWSSVGYAFGNSIAHGTVENQGSGGINMAYLGVAGTYAGFSLGMNVSYNFGNIQNDNYLNPSNSGQGLVERVMQIRDWNIDLGLQYTLKLGKTDRMVFGLTYAPKKSLHGKAWVTQQELTMETLPDTVGFIKLKNHYQTPNSVGVGVSYKHERISRWMAEVDFAWQQWSKVKYTAIPKLDGTGDAYAPMQFADRLRVAVGGEYVPKLRGNYIERTAYRLGAYFNNDYLKILGNRVREYGITCGFGLHTPQDKTMINIGFEWKKRRAYPNALISENYYNITLGINFNEVWFWQRKIR